jgi:hypothetical protein
MLSVCRMENRKLEDDTRRQGQQNIVEEIQTK